MTRRNTTTKTGPGGAVRHRPVIRRDRDASGWVYRMRCPCGTTGEDRPVRRLAERDLNQHVKALPKVPADRQCKRPKEHDRRPWEPCGLCAGQVALFDELEVDR